MLNEFESEQYSTTRLLNNCINTDRYSHAYLFVINGYKNAYEYIYSFIKMICCPNNRKCDGCNICSLIDTNSFSDFKFISTDALTMNKDVVLELKDYFETKKIYARKRVYLIKDCEKMNITASNTILKFLEEPEDDIIAILTTDNINQVIDTIKSRCQIIYFNTSSSDIGLEGLYNQITTVDIGKEFDEFKLDVSYILNFCKFYEKNRISTIAFSKKEWHDYFSDRVKFKYGLEILLYIYMDVLNYKMGKKMIYFEAYIDEIRQISNNNFLIFVNRIKTLLKYIDLIKYNINLGLCFDKIIMEWEGM